MPDINYNSVVTDKDLNHIKFESVLIPGRFFFEVFFKSNENACQKLVITTTDR